MINKTIRGKKLFKMEPSTINIINTGKLVKIKFLRELEEIINKNYSNHNNIIEEIKKMNPIYDFFKSEINLSGNPVLIYSDINNYLYINKILMPKIETTHSDTFDKYNNPSNHDSKYNPNPYDYDSKYNPNPSDYDSKSNSSTLLEDDLGVD